MSLGDEQRNLSRLSNNVDFVKFFVFDVLVATIFGLVSWIVTKDQITSFMISLGIASILILVELRFQVAISKEEIARAVGLQRASMDDRHLMVTIQNVVDGYTKVATSGNELFINRAREVLGLCAADMNKLREGYIEFPPRKPTRM